MRHAHSSKQHQAGRGDPPATTANSTGFYACPSSRAICDLIGRIGRFGRADAPVDFPFFDGLPDSSRETSIPVEAVEVLHHRVVRLGDCFLLVEIPFARCGQALLRPAVLCRDVANHGERGIGLGIKLCFDNFSHEDVRRRVLGSPAQLL